MRDRHDQPVGDVELTAALRSLVDRDGPSDMRVRVEQVLNATPAPAVPHTAWRWGYGLVLTVGMFLVAAILSLPRSDEEQRHAVLPPAPDFETAHGRVPSGAVPSLEIAPQAAHVSPRSTDSAGRAEQPSISARVGATAQLMLEDPWPEWSPAALLPPTAIAAADIGVAPIAVKAPVVTRLQAIEALP